MEKTNIKIQSSAKQRALGCMSSPLDHLQPVKPIFSPKFSNFYIFIMGSPILITLERWRLKLGKWNSPNLSETHPRERKAENGKIKFSQPEWVPGTFKLDHLQPVRPVLFPKFSNFYIFILASPILSTPERRRLKIGKWNSPNLSEAQGFECLWHSNWTICSLLSQFCSLNFPTSTSLYWEAQFLLPQREGGWKWENGNLPTWVRHRGLSVWGIQTGPFAAC